jgi:hypothetical protein
MTCIRSRHRKTAMALKHLSDYLLYCYLLLFSVCFVCCIAALLIFTSFLLVFFLRCLLFLHSASSLFSYGFTMIAIFTTVRTRDYLSVVLPKMKTTPQHLCGHAILYERALISLYVLHGTTVDAYYSYCEESCTSKN